MDHNRCSATALTATDRDATVRDSVADSATGSDVVAVREVADVDKDSFGAVANPGDSARHAVVALAANCVDASCYRGRDLDLDHASDPSHDCSVAVVVVVPSAVHGRVTVGSAPGVAAATAVHGPAIGGSVRPVAVAAVAAAAVVPNAVAGPGYRAVAAAAVVPNAAVAPDCRAVVPGDAVPSVAAVVFVVVAEWLAVVAGWLAVLADGHLALAGVAAGAVRVRPDSPGSAPRRDRVCLGRWPNPLRPTTKSISLKIMPNVLNSSLFSNPFSTDAERGRPIALRQVLFHAVINSKRLLECRFMKRFGFVTNDMG